MLYILNKIRSSARIERKRKEICERSPSGDSLNFIQEVTGRAPICNMLGPSGSGKTATVHNVIGMNLFCRERNKTGSRDNFRIQVRDGGGQNAFRAVIEGDQGYKTFDTEVECRSWIEGNKSIGFERIDKDVSLTLFLKDALPINIIESPGLEVGNEEYKQSLEDNIIRHAKDSSSINILLCEFGALRNCSLKSLLEVNNLTIDFLLFTGPKSTDTVENYEEVINKGKDWVKNDNMLCTRNCETCECPRVFIIDQLNPKNHLRISDLLRRDEKIFNDKITSNTWLKSYVGFYPFLLEIGKFSTLKCEHIAEGFENTLKEAINVMSNDHNGSNSPSNLTGSENSEENIETILDMDESDHLKLQNSLIDLLRLKVLMLLAKKAFDDKWIQKDNKETMSRHSRPNFNELFERIQGELVKHIADEMQEFIIKWLDVINFDRNISKDFQDCFFEVASEHFEEDTVENRWKIVINTMKMVYETFGEFVKATLNPLILNTLKNYYRPSANEAMSNHNIIKIHCKSIVINLGSAVEKMGRYIKPTAHQTLDNLSNKLLTLAENINSSSDSYQRMKDVISKLESLPPVEEVCFKLRGTLKTKGIQFNSSKLLSDLLNLMKLVKAQSDNDAHDLFIGITHGRLEITREKLSFINQTATSIMQRLGLKMEITAL